ncbi:cytochrome P450 [Mycena olivaceomarginata]|nr:cytochrome P450 [Mycena olivaceomarginata]
MPVVLYSSIAITAALIIVGLVQHKQRTSMLPPGPPGDPLIGNLLRMPSKDSALVFHEWSKTYGCVDLLDKKGLIYSDRPKFTLYELLGWDPTLAFLQYGEKFNKHRQMHQSYLSRSRLEDFKSIQTQEARTLLRHLIQCPPDKYETFVSIITQIVAGHRITSEDDPYLRMSDIVSKAMSKTGPPGGRPIDFFPLLQHFPAWFPGASHIGIVKAYRPTVRELHEHSMEDGEDVEDLKGFAATMFAAGESTTWSTLTVFIIAMVLHPEIQAKAQKEIDSIVGDLRLPEFGDRGDLPFVEAILQETLRRAIRGHFRTPGQAKHKYYRGGTDILEGVPHRATKNDVYNGMLIPKGTLIFANIKGMALDESVYSNPLSFQPERFLAKPGGAGEPHFNQAFGFGRRICTGQYVADNMLEYRVAVRAVASSPSIELLSHIASVWGSFQHNSLWIAIASILATCRITNAVDESGEIIVPDNTLTDGLVRQVPMKSPDLVQR